MAIDLEGLCREWHQNFAGSDLDYQDGYYDDEEDNDSNINLRLVKPYVANGLQWLEMGSDPQIWGPERKLTMMSKSYASYGSEATGHLSATKESELLSSVTIIKGVVQGLTTKLRLELPKHVVRQLGKYVEIDLSQMQTDIPIDKMTLGITVDQPVTDEEASATIRSKTAYYHGHFKCFAGLSGKVLFKEAGSGILQTDIFDIVRDMKDQDDGHGWLNKFQVNKREQTVTFPVEGQAMFSWAFEQNFVLN